MGVIGLGSDSGPERMRIPSPPQNRTTFIVDPPCKGLVGLF